MSNPRFYFEMFGFFPTSKESARERDILNLAENKVDAWLKTSELHAGNARWRYHDIGVFAQDEAKQMFADTSTDEELKKLLPTTEACETFIKAIIFAKISDNNGKFLEEKHVRGSWGGAVPSMTTYRYETGERGGGGGGGGGGNGSSYFRVVPSRREESFPLRREHVLPMRGGRGGSRGMGRFQHHHRLESGEGAYKRARNVTEENEQDY
jgi:hypothetical protein